MNIIFIKIIVVLLPFLWQLQGVHLILCFFHTLGSGPYNYCSECSISLGVSVSTCRTNRWQIGVKEDMAGFRKITKNYVRNTMFNEHPISKPHKDIA